MKIENTQAILSHLCENDDVFISPNDSTPSSKSIYYFNEDSIWSKQNLQVFVNGKINFIAQGTLDSRLLYSRPYRLLSKETIKGTIYEMTSLQLETLDYYKKTPRIQVDVKCELNGYSVNLPVYMHRPELTLISKL